MTDWGALTPLFEEHLTDQGCDSLELDIGGRICTVKQDRGQRSRGGAAQEGDVDDPTARPGLTEHVSTTGAVVWDGSVVLARYLAAHGLAEGARVVEVGAGCSGLPTLAALTSGAGAALCVASDRAPLLPSLRANLERSLRGPVERARLVVLELLWGAELPAQLAERAGGRSTFDVVAAADCVYDAELVDPLVRTLHALCAADGVVLCAWDASVGRRQSYALLRARLPELFGSVEEVPFERRLPAGSADVEAVKLLAARLPRALAGRIASA